MLKVGALDCPEPEDEECFRHVNRHARCPGEPAVVKPNDGESLQLYRNSGCRCDALLLVSCREDFAVNGWGICFCVGRDRCFASLIPQLTWYAMACIAGS